jgi:hypothetical protein
MGGCLAVRSSARTQKEIGKVAAGDHPADSSRRRNAVAVNDLEW